MPSKTLHFPSPRHLHSLYAGREENLVHAERVLGVKLTSRDDQLHIDPADPTDDTPTSVTSASPKFAGADPQSTAAVAAAAELFGLLDDARGQGLAIGTADFHRFTDAVARGGAEQLRALCGSPLVITTPRGTIVPKTLGQKTYLRLMHDHPVVFGIGPAGTGKTYLAVAQAVAALQAGAVRRIILTRPAVEAGETLGFLPGDLREKILPYLRPLYDALHDMLDAAELARLAERSLIEIAPLAYMRGRTLSHAFVILDEAQNTTSEQMLMFLTRLGEESRMVITGDVTQIDLPRAKISGLLEAQRVLAGVPDVASHHFDVADVVRHPLVQRIIAAYDRHRNPITRENGTEDRK
ncbi:MAG: PhoH family protein [Verrucomicrobiota bacterium]